MTLKSTAPKAITALVALAALTATAGPAFAQTSEPATASDAAAAGRPGGPVSCTSTRDPKLAERLSADISAALRSRRSTASVALYDQMTGTTCQYRAHRTYDAASTVKPIVLGALLQSKQGKLSPKDKALAAKMIIKSDNSATTALWNKLSGARGVQAFLDSAGMRDTVPGRAGNWGLTKVSAADQLTLLKLFTQKNDVLNNASRTYALGLMNKVQADQRWGATAGAPASALVHVKNGWLHRSSGRGIAPFARKDWKINSMAAFTGRGHDRGLVVLTENNRPAAGHRPAAGKAYGIGTIEAVARVVHRDLAGR
ncbi:serine hydrolase [Streptomyces vinaceus]|uniref:serine hydrolase n=1 Tax=Streptomyces vinaceus TaxID=1960 RepID=UPI003825470A